MGAFDDLIPKAQSGGLFADLIPSAPAQPPSDPDLAGLFLPQPAGRGMPDMHAMITPPAEVPTPRMPGLPPMVSEPMDTYVPDVPFDPRALPRPSVPQAPVIGQNIGQPQAPDPFAGERFGDLAGRRGQQFVQGAAEVYASIPEALAISAAGLEYAMDESQRQRIAGTMELLDTIRGDMETPDLPPEVQLKLAENAQMLMGRLAMLREGQETMAQGGPIVPPEEREGFAAGDKVRDFAEELVGAPDPRDESFWGKLAQGGGSMAAFVSTALLPGGALTTAGTGAALNSAAIYREAREEGLSPEESMAATRLAGLLGATEAVPITRALNVLPQRVRGQVSNQLVRRLTSIAQSSGEEAAQEAIVGIGNNLIAQGYYDPERGTFENVGEQALIGAILGGAVNVGGQALDAARQPAAVATPEPAPTPDTLPAPEVNVPQPDTGPMRLQPDQMVEPMPEAAVTSPDEPVTPDQTPEEPDAPTEAQTDEAPVNPDAEELVALASRAEQAGDAGFAEELRRIAESGEAIEEELKIFYTATVAALEEQNASQVTEPVTDEGVTDPVTTQRPVEPPPAETPPVDDPQVDDLGNPVPRMGGLINPAMTPEGRRAQGQAGAQARGMAAQAGAGLSAITDEMSKRPPPFSPDAGRRQFNEDMDTLETERAAMAARGEEVPETISYTFQRPGGTTRYQIPTDVDDSGKSGIERFKERMNGPAISVDLNNTRGGAKAPITVEQFLADRMGTVTDRNDGMIRSAKPSDVTDEMIEDLERELGRSLKRGDKLTFPKEDAPKKQPKNKATVAGRFAERSEAEASVGRRPRGKQSPQFMKFSMTNKPSVYGAAIEDAGISADEARIMDTDKLNQRLGKMIEEKFGVTVELPMINVRRKNIVGRSVVTPKQSISSRKAQDQLLDAYRQMQMLAHIMNLPEKAIGLPLEGKGITLSLISQKRLRGALGMFSHMGARGKRTIHLPDRSNSFAHEWGHAFDHYLGVMSMNGVFKDMMSRRMAAGEVNAMATPRRAVTEGFAHVMHAMFGDRAALGAMMIDLQTQAAEVNETGNPTPKAQTAQKILSDLKNGKKPPESVVSAYFQSAKAYDDMVGADGYFTDPAEMFARAFEAWVGRSVAMISDLPQSFLSKGEWGYTDQNDARLALTFPKGADSQQFAIAMSKLQHALSLSGLFGGDAKAQKPDDVDIYGLRAANVREKRFLANIAGQEKEAMKEAIFNARSAIPSARTKIAKSAEGVDTIYKELIESSSATMHAIASRQAEPKAKEALMSIYRQVGTMPGRGEPTRTTYERIVERRAKRIINRVENKEGVIRQTLGRDLKKPERKIIRDLLTGGSPKGQSPELVKVAAGLRRVLDEVWYDLTNEGVEVGYQKGWLPRIYNDAAINASKASRKDFREKAQRVYQIMFDREVSDNGNAESQADDINAVVNGLQSVKAPTPDGDVVADPRLGDDTMKKVETWRGARSKAKKIAARLKDAKTEDTRKRLKAELAAAQKEVDGALGSLLPALSDAWSKWSADQWFTKIQVGQINEYGSMGPTSNFLKGRVLPKETETILAEYMVEDPVELIHMYAFAASRRIEYAKRFGPKSEKLRNMLEAAADAGASQEDIDLVKQAVNAVTGRMQSSGRGWALLRSSTYVYGAISVLNMATLSSLHESSAAGLRSGDLRDLFMNMARLLASFVRIADTKEKYRLAREIGMISSYMTETVIHNKLGMEVPAIGGGSEKILAGFFNMIGLTPLTMHQRAMTIPVAHAVLMRHLRKSVRNEGLTGKLRDKAQYGDSGAFSNGELNELGVLAEDREALLDWLESLDGIPTPEDLYGPDGYYHRAGELWQNAITTFVDETVQNPTKADSPIMASHPDHAALYAIQTFITGFHRNLIMRTFRRGLSDQERAGGKLSTLGGAIVLAAPTVVAFYALSLLSTTIRELLTNGEKWEEKDDEDELLEWLMWRAGFRAGFAGRFDPLIQMVAGVKYDRDLTTMFAGPYLGYLLQNTQQILEVFNSERNSANTNTAEHAAVQAFWNLAIKPAALMGLAGFSPMGPLSVNAGRTAAVLGLGPWVRGEQFADWMVGEKGTKYQNGPPWWEIGDGILP